MKMLFNKNMARFSASQVNLIVILLINLRNIEIIDKLSA